MWGVIYCWIMTVCVEFIISVLTSLQLRSFSNIYPPHCIDISGSNRNPIEICAVPVQLPVAPFAVICRASTR